MNPRTGKPDPSVEVPEDLRDLKLGRYVRVRELRPGVRFRELTDEVGSTDVDTVPFALFGSKV
jgi:hypothetical protein